MPLQEARDIVTHRHTLLVLGATKGIGAATVARALERGHHVRALSRRAEETLDTTPDLTPISADATDVDALADAMAGVDTVIYTVGVDHGINMVLRPVTLFSESMAAVLRAMDRTGRKRLIAVTGYGAGDSKETMPLWARWGHWAVLGRAYDDKDRQEDLVRNSQVEWTLVRPVILTHGPATQAFAILREPKEWRNGFISRNDVAHYLVEAAESACDLQRAVVLRG